MDANIAQIAVEFMKRVSLTGAEVEAYSAVMQALMQEAAKQPEVTNDEAE